MNASSLPDQLPIPAYRCAVQLQCTHVNGPKQAHPLSIYEAIVKGVTERAGLAEKVTPLFYWPQRRAPSMQLSLDQTVTLHIDLYGAEESTAQHWRETLAGYFDEDAPGRNFCIRRLEAVQPIALNPTVPDAPIQEVCLDFLTPFPFQTTRGKPRDWLDGQMLAKALQSRLSKLFQYPAASQSTFDGAALLLVVLPNSSCVGFAKRPCEISQWLRGAFVRKSRRRNLGGVVALVAVGGARRTWRQGVVRFGALSVAVPESGLFPRDADQSQRNR